MGIERKRRIEKTDHEKQINSTHCYQTTTETKQNRRVMSMTAVMIECLEGSTTAVEWSREMVQTGDIVEEIRIGSSRRLVVYNAPFKNGRNGVQKLLHASYKRGQTSIVVRVRRGRNDFVELHACIVPMHDGPSTGKRQQTGYVLRSIHDPNYAVAFADRMESDCLMLQGISVLLLYNYCCLFSNSFLDYIKFICSPVIAGWFKHSGTRSSRIVSALDKAQVRDGFNSYPWERKMRETLPVFPSSTLLSLVVFPKATDDSNSRYTGLDDTLARANAWFNSSQASGVPITFMSVQTEQVLTKVTN